MMNTWARFNEWVASKLTLLVATMACVYLFTIWGLLPAVFPDTRDVVFYVSGGILQLVLLPLIMVGQSVLNRKTEERAEEDHMAILAEFGEIKEMHVDLSSEIAGLQQIAAQIADLKTVIESLARPPAAKPIVDKARRKARKS